MTPPRLDSPQALQRLMGAAYPLSDQQFAAVTAPLAPATMRALTTPGSDARSSSARLMGKTIPAIDEASADG